MSVSNIIEKKILLDQYNYFFKIINFLNYLNYNIFSYILSKMKENLHTQLKTFSNYSRIYYKDAIFLVRKRF